MSENEATMMTQLELQRVLGEEIKKVWDSEKLPRETQLKVLDTATVISSLSKQMINNADIILRTEKLVGENKLGKSTIVKMINGEAKEST